MCLHMLDTSIVIFPMYIKLLMHWIQVCATDTKPSACTNMQASTLCTWARIPEGGLENGKEQHDWSL